MLNSIETNSILAWVSHGQRSLNEARVQKLQRVSWVNEHTHTHTHVVLGRLRENKIWSIFISSYLLSFVSSIKFSEQALCFCSVFLNIISYMYFHILMQFTLFLVVMEQHRVQIVDSSLSLFICIIFLLYDLVEKIYKETWIWF